MMTGGARFRQTISFGCSRSSEVTLFSLQFLAVLSFLGRRCPLQSVSYGGEQGGEGDGEGSSKAERARRCYRDRTRPSFGRRRPLSQCHGDRRALLAVHVEGRGTAPGNGA